MHVAKFVGSQSESGGRVGDRFGRYHLLTELGSGTEGTSFAALDEGTGQRVALKVFREVDEGREARVRQDFLRLTGLGHPGIVCALDLGRHEGRLYLVTSLQEGAPLTSIPQIADDGVRASRFVRLARELADAVAYLHSRGVVHGDISPANVCLAADGRAVLIDLGSFGVASSAGGAFGTLGFAAPEALIGAVTPTSDLFSLGATLFFSWSGVGPFGVGGAAVQRMLTEAPPALSKLRRGVSVDWDTLLGELLDRDPQRRPSSARMVLKRIQSLDPERGGGALPALLPPYPSGDPLTGIFVGRELERQTLLECLTELRAGSAPVAAINLFGPEGIGRRSLITTVLRDNAVSQLSSGVPPMNLFRGALGDLSDWLMATYGPQLDVRVPSSSEPAAQPGDASDPVRTKESGMAILADWMETCARRTPICAVLDVAPESAAFARFVTGAPASGRLLLIVATADPMGTLAARDVALPRLTEREIETYLRRVGGAQPPLAVVQTVVSLSGGNCAALALIARQWIEAERSGSVFAPSEGTTGLDVLLRQRFQVLPPDVRAAIAGAYCGRLDAANLPGDIAGNRAVEMGWLISSAGDAIELPSAAHERVLQQALSDADLRSVVTEAVARGRVKAERLGYAFDAISDSANALAAFRAAAQEAVRSDHGVSDRVVRCLSEVARISGGDLSADESLLLASGLALQGRMADAVATLSGHIARFPVDDVVNVGAFPINDRLRLLERKAMFLAKSGDLQQARAQLSLLQNVSLDEASPDIVAAAWARLSRILFSLGLLEEAITKASIALEVAARSDSTGAPEAAVETLVLAEAYRGHWPAARSWLSQFVTRGFSSSRAEYLGALVAHLSGDLTEAMDRYARAFRQAEAAADVHTLSAIALNLGALAAEAGRYDEALAKQDRAIRELGRLGASAELGSALFNAGILLTELGDLSAARKIAERLQSSERDRESDSSRRSLVSTSTLAYLDGEIAVREGRDDDALACLVRARAASDGEQRVRRAASLATAELLARKQRAADAEEVLAAILADASADSASDADPLSLADWYLSRARVSLSAVVVDATDSKTEDFIGPLGRAAQLANKSGRKPLVWRLALAAARLFHRAGRLPDAQRLIELSRNAFEEIRMSIPSDYRQGFEQDRDARLLADLGRATNAQATKESPGSTRSERADSRLRRLLRINKRLNSELRLPKLLELIMDTLIELTEAERGFVLLEDDDGELVVKVARNMDQQSLDAEGFELSQSIARQAASGGQPIVTIDAGMDPRFREAVSVSDLHLRSVLAVPLQIKGRAVGTIYVDNRLRKGAFDEDDIQLVLDFAEQAAIAIENARLIGEVRRRERQIEVLNRRLSEDLEARKEELSGMKQELRENREALAIRYDYRNIVGRTPRMLELFRLLDRLTDTILPVVIQGESGTGKELVARALHFNGARKDRPFVSENCAAIPETLLETALFGSVKGAYTGADHDARGLFEVADGGTLFLDEVGEMSPSMQGKLLRVLQSGEMRRVGSERIRKVDVRIITATNRDLGRMVEEGRFRQDLFFRLSVARIALPPLRERREDIPAIVDHVLNRTGNGRAEKAAAKRIEPSALARLMAYRWPGNVRELENELLRASALCQDSITTADLSPHITDEGVSSVLAVADSPDSLTIRPRVERLERSLLREALSRHTGNQTKAAEALGLSRFGLQKKLKRYRMG